MPRSLKKGPFVDDHLLKKVDATATSRARRRSSRPGRVVRPSSPTWSATPSPCTTAASTCRCTSPSRWSVTSSASSPPPARSGSTPARNERSSLMAVRSPRPTSVRVPGPGQVRPAVGLQGPRGARPDSRQVLRRGPRDPRSSPSAASPRWSASVSTRPSPTPRTTTSIPPKSCSSRPATPTRVPR